MKNKVYDTVAHVYIDLRYRYLLIDDGKSKVLVDSCNEFLIESLQFAKIKGHKKIDNNCILLYI